MYGEASALSTSLFDRSTTRFPHPHLYPQQIPEYQDSTEKIRGMLGAASIISLNFEVMGREANVIALGKFMMRCGQLNECEQLQHVCTPDRIIFTPFFYA